MTQDAPAVSLNTGTAARLDPRIAAPTYDRDFLRRAIVHIGVGGFHRAHLAVYIDDLCRAGNQQWSIVGAGVLAHDQRIATALTAQDGYYCLIIKGHHDTEVRLVASIVDFIHGHPSATELVARIADPDTQIVSMTITEGGYPVDDLNGAYEADSPQAGPDSAFGVLAAGLDRRRQNESGPLTVMSCDNILSNGHVARTSLLGEAARLDPELAAWVEQNVSFPNSMVDRITPATTDQDRHWLLGEYNVIDQWPVVTEPFTQWVLEDNFAADRPPVEDLGVILTDNVEPYEHMKLRLLNAGHSCLAYLAALLGIEHVHTAMADPAIRLYVEQFLHREAKPVLAPVPGIDLDDYIASLIERFSNPGVGDQIDRLCLDGSAKFPKFLLPTIRAELAVDGPIELAALGLAGWRAYLNGESEVGKPIVVASDPLRAAAIEHAAASASEPAKFLKFADVFESDLAEHPRFVAAFAAAAESIRDSGIRSTIEQLAGG